MTTPLSNTNYAQIVSEAQNKIKELLNLEGLVEAGSEKGGKSGKSGYNRPDIGGLLNGTANNVMTLVQGNDQQKAGAIQEIVSDLMDMFSNLGVGANSAARKEVKNNDKKIEENKKSAEETSNKVSAKVQEILDSCEGNSAKIAEALESIKELGGDKGQIAELEKQLEDYVKVIEDNQKKLADQNASPEDKKTALIEILNASKLISELVEQVEDFKTLIEEQNSVVKENTEKLTESMTEGSTVISDGVKSITQNLTEAGVLTQYQAKMSIKAAKNIGTGAAQETTGQAMTSFWATAAQGAKFILSGNDKLSAGATLMQGSVQGLSKLTGSIGEMGQYLTYFTEFGNGLGSFAQGAFELVGQYDSTVNPTIASIGTWEQVAEGSKELNSAVQQYAQTALGENVDTSSSESTPSFIPDFTQQGEEIEVSDVAEKDAKTMNFATPFEFDTSKLKLKSQPSV